MERIQKWFYCDYQLPSIEFNYNDEIINYLNIHQLNGKPVGG